MTRYYFDIRDEGYIFPDEEGLEFFTLRDAKMEAAFILSNLAWDAGRSGGDHDIAIEVRSDAGLQFQVALIVHGPKQ